MVGNLGVPRLAHGGDLLGLQYAAHTGQIQLENIAALLLQKGRELVFGGQPFPCGDGDGGGLGYLL